jgi:type IV secretory pathway VirD2 relaxase
VTRELGRQSELEVTKQLEREVAADRFTGLDRMLIAEQRGREFSDLRPDQDMRDTFRQNRALLIERARKLERMGLATEIETGKWIVSPKAEPVLRELGERGDIIKTMHRALEREGLAEDPPSRALCAAPGERNRAHHRPRARQGARRRRDG